MKERTSSIILSVFLSMLFAIGSSGNTVTYDTVFNGSGYRLQTVGTESASGYSLAIQSDGKILLAGKTRTAAETDQFAIIRLNADGSLDSSFGSGGTAFTPTEIRATGWDPKIVLQPDGKILMGTTAMIAGEQVFKFFVFRYTESGELDTTFNGSGYATANVPTSFWDICNAIGVGEDGKIVLVGQALTTPGQQPDWDMAVVRFNSNGSLDTSFDSDGITKIGAASADEEFHSVMVQADGKIIVGGRETTDRERFLLTRLNANGSVDSTFGSAGWNIIYIDAVNNNVNSFARQSDGRILAGGGGKVMRFSANGVRDMSFGKNGVQSNTGAIEKIDIRVIAGDKFVVGTRYGVRRFMPNGALDTHYDGSFSVSGHNCYMGSLGIQTDGKAVLGGYCRNQSDNITRFAVTRFQENRTKRFLSFGGGERSEISIYRPSNGQWWMLYDSFQTVAGTFGLPNDRPVPADFTGDGRTDLAVFRPSTGEWFVLRSDDGSFYSFPFGTAGDIPVAGDFDEDQIADAGVYRPSTNEWYIQRSSGGLLYTVFGASGDKVVPSDYDGDFKMDIAIFRPSTGQWWIKKSSDGLINVLQFGNSTDTPVQGEYTGDNKTDAAFYRPQTGEWFVLRSENNSFYSLPFGLSEDIPLPGNYSGDARFDFTVFRPSTNRWHFLPSGGSYYYKDFGSAGDVPLASISAP